MPPELLHIWRHLPKLTAVFVCVHVVLFSVSLHCTAAHFCREVRTRMHCWYNCQCRHFYLLTFCSLHSLRPCAEGTVREGLCGSACHSCWLAYFFLLTGCNFHQGQAASSGPRFCCVEGRDFGDLGVARQVQEVGMGEKEWCGSRGYVCPWARICVFWGSGLPGQSGTVWYESEEAGAQLQKPSDPAGWERLPCLLPTP